MDEDYSVFIPSPLPPAPALDLSGLFPLIDEANGLLGRLDTAITTLADPGVISYMYVRREALLSSQIEGTQSSFDDLMRFENDQMPGVPLEDVEEVSSYVAAMNHGLKRLGEGFPLSLRLIREIHRVLLKNARGERKNPGEFRTSQNWIGGTRPGKAKFVPPPPENLMELLGDLEKFLYDDKASLPLLVKAALVHVQFETIHPFLDGNGRLGRLLIAFLLCHAGVLRAPTLYLSLYFKENRDEYYDLLQRVRLTGDWEAWLHFFLNGVIETCRDGLAKMQKIEALLTEDMSALTALGRSRATAEKVLSVLKRRPIANVRTLTECLTISKPTATLALRNLEKLNIVEEITGGRYGKTYAYSAYIKLLGD